MLLKLYLNNIYKTIEWIFTFRSGRNTNHEKLKNHSNVWLRILFTVPPTVVSDNWVMLLKCVIARMWTGLACFRYGYGKYGHKVGTILNEE